MGVTAREAPHPPRLYGRRRGRALRPGRNAAIAERLPDYALSLPPDGTPIDPRSLFAADVADVWLEIGFGSGEHLLGRAAMHPEVGFIGCEPWIDGVAALLAKTNPTLLPRLRVLPGDARPLLGTLCNNSLGRVFVLFSDPWPKRRHHRRRLIGAETLHHIARALRPGGELLFASDHRDYVRWTLALADEEQDLVWCARRPHDWKQPPDGWVPTRYQRKAEARGADCHYLLFRRRPEP